MVKTSIFFVFVFLSIALSCTSSATKEVVGKGGVSNFPQQQDQLKKAYFASGCFWCVEAIFENVKGVEEVVSGYSGGTKKAPTYEEVCTGNLRHAEAVEVYYDPQKVDYKTLLQVFFGSHDPTTIDRQGPDRGPQYRSIIFYTTEGEKQLAESYIQELDASMMYPPKIITEVVPFEVFYPAEDYHQDYEKNHPNNPYIQSVSIPRMLKFESKFPQLLKIKH